MTLASVNEPQFSQGQAIRIKAEGATDSPPPLARGKSGRIEGYAGWFGSGSTLPIRSVHHQYFVRADGETHLIMEDWLEPAPN